MTKRLFCVFTVKLLVSTAHCEVPYTYDFTINTSSVDQRVKGWNVLNSNPFNKKLNRKIVVQDSSSISVDILNEKRIDAKRWLEDGVFVFRELKLKPEMTLNLSQKSWTVNIRGFMVMT